MRKRLLIAAGLAAAAIAGPACAAEVMIANIMPGAATWQLDGAQFMTVPNGQHGYKPLAAGRWTVRVTDAGGRSVTQVLAFDSAQVARLGGREFWCLASRANAGQPEILLLDQATCQQFIDNQPPK